MRGTGMTACLLAIQLLAMPAAMAGEMYQWTDANGKRHFTDKPPPPGVEAQRSTLRELPATGKRAAEPEEEPRDPAAAEAAYQREAAADRAEARRAREEAKQERKEAQKRWAAQQEEREWEEAKRQRDQKEEKCRNLKEAADRAYSFKSRWEKECG